ncbi:MAG TPA: ABC transporter ATP-binding protein, partial [Actinomycetota bacterium]|nr:ABC transporter ATP-binding protein [Actinomycetota bacterium]
MAAADGSGARPGRRGAGPEGRTGAGLLVRELTVRYPGRAADALRGVGLAVEPGELVGVAGRNGAGKSTLALAAAGLIPRVVRARVSGSVTVDGEPVLGADPARRRHRVGIVFPSPHNQISATKFTVREELAFGLENLGVPRAEMDERIDRVMADLGIEHLADRYPFHLSGGEQQRVAIAAVLAMGSEVLVLDEPTAQLDPAGLAAVAGILRREAGRGIAVLAAEHAVPVLAEAVRCVLLDEGRAVVEGRPGVVLGSAVLEPLGLRPPELVALAELAGTASGDLTDEAALAAGLARAAQAGRLPERMPAGRVPAASWEPVRRHPPTGVEVRRLVHRYPGGVEALRGVSLEIPPGQKVAVVGRNGSGKTTLVKHLNGLLRPDVGEVRVGGEPVADRPVHLMARTVGFVFQDPDDQLFERTVEREVRFGPRNLGLDRGTVDRLVEAALAATGLAGRRDENPHDLGPSDRKLVAIASVLAMDPAVVVLDEPTTGQDGPGVARVGAIVDALAAAGRTVVAVTHDVGFAAERFDRIVVMREGEVVLDGSPTEVFAPGHAATLASTGLTPPVAARVGARL